MDVDADESEAVDDVALDDVVELVALGDVPTALCELAAAVVVVVLCPSRQARTPPRESVAATLRAVASLRARAARGARRRRDLGAVGSSMPVNVRRAGEATARRR